jgi:hypothetical protein
MKIAVQLFVMTPQNLVNSAFISLITKFFDAPYWKTMSAAWGRRHPCLQAAPQARYSAGKDACAPRSSQDACAPRKISSNLVIRLFMLNLRD